MSTGKVIGPLHCRHRAEEFRKFLAALDRDVPDGLDVHLVLDGRCAVECPASSVGLAERAVQGLDLGLLVHAEHECPLRRVEVELDDVVDLLDEEEVWWSA